MPLSNFEMMMPWMACSYPKFGIICLIPGVGGGGVFAKGGEYSGGFRIWGSSNFLNGLVPQTKRRENHL